MISQATSLRVRAVSAKPLGALRGAVILLHARADERERTALLRQEMPGGRRAHLRVGEADRHVDRLPAEFPHLHDGHAARLQELPGLGAVRQAGQHDGGRSPGEGGAHQGLLLILAIFAVTEEDLKPFRASSDWRVETVSAKKALRIEGTMMLTTFEDAAANPPATRFGT